MIVYQKVADCLKADRKDFICQTTENALYLLRGTVRAGFAGSQLGGADDRMGQGTGSKASGHSLR